MKENKAAKIQNSILALLPKKDFEQVLPLLKEVTLKKGEVIYSSGDLIKHVYFPTTAVISLFTSSTQGQTVEVGMVGYEGFVGLPVLWQAKKSPFEAVAQIAGNALQAEAKLMNQEFKRCGILQDVLLRYMNALCTQVAQSAMCNRFHTLEERLCRWLLVSQDRRKTNTLELTQELISAMLGSNRSHVTMTARMLQRAELISYKRGVITLLDRAGLEETACECYGIVKKEFDHFLAVEP